VPSLPIILLQSEANQGFYMKMQAKPHTTACLTTNVAFAKKHRTKMTRENIDDFSEEAFL